MSMRRRYGDAAVCHRAGGTSLIELLAGLALAGIVSAIVTVALAASGAALRQHVARVRGEDAAWQALGAMVRDLRRASTWSVCTEARDCPVRSHRAYRGQVLRADTVDWLLSNGLRRCDASDAKQGDCLEFVQGIVAFEILGDTVNPDGTVTREPLQQRHESRARLVEVTLVLADGRRFSQAVALRKAAANVAPHVTTQVTRHVTRQVTTQVTRQVRLHVTPDAAS